MTGPDRSYQKRRLFAFALLCAGPATSGLLNSLTAYPRLAAVSPQAYIKALQKHLGTVLRDGECLFPDGGWKLSSTSDNSWLSKVYLSQFVAHEVLALPIDDNSRAADAAHASWLRDPRNSYFSWSDQMIRGSAVGAGRRRVVAAGVFLWSARSCG